MVIILNKIENFDLNNENIDSKILEEYVLVQGIIDLYGIDDNGEIILVDYKTDFVEEGQEHILKERYTKQLELYKKCLEESLNTKVKETYIYSLYLNKEIKL